MDLIPTNLDGVYKDKMSGAIVNTRGSLTEAKALMERARRGVDLADRVDAIESKMDLILELLQKSK